MVDWNGICFQEIKKVGSGILGVRMLRTACTITMTYLDHLS